MRKLKFLFVLLAMVSLASYGFEEGKSIGNEIKSENTAEYYDTESNNSDAKFLTAFSCKEYREHYLIATIMGLISAICILLVETIFWLYPIQTLLPRKNAIKLKNVFIELKSWKNCSKKLRHSAIICLIALFILACTLIALLFPKIFVDDINNKFFHNTMGVIIPFGIMIFAFGIHILIRKEDRFKKIGKLIRILRTIIYVIVLTMFFIITCYDFNNFIETDTLSSIFLPIFTVLTFILYSKKMRTDGEVEVQQL